jgi:hypothetical protein
MRCTFGHFLTTLSLLSMSSFLSIILNAKAETALEVQSWCKDIVNVQLTQDDRVAFQQRYASGFCWGAFGTLQDVSRIPTEIDGHLYLFCPPRNSTRVQFVKVFSRYVDTHPAVRMKILG